jgi:hypothetical protein
MNTAKNYMRQGGKEWHIGGSVVIDPGGQIVMITPRKHVYFVDTTVAASGAGTSWATAFKTLTEATALAVSGDTIYIYTGTGNTYQINEAITLTGLNGITFVGGGTNPNQAVWTAPDTAAPALTLSASPDCRVINIKMRPPLHNAAISLIGASNYFRLEMSKIQGKTGSYYGILSDGSQGDVHILDNEFCYINTDTYGTAIKGQTYATADPTGWVIKRNEFFSNLNHIVCAMRQSQIKENGFASVGVNPAGAAQITAIGIDLSGGSSGVGANVVTRNDLGGLYQTSVYKAAVTAGAGADEWAGNYCVDRTHDTQVDDATGLSRLVPA